MSRFASITNCVLGVAAGAVMLGMSFVWAGSAGAPLLIGQSLWAVRAAAVGSIVCAPVLAWGGWQRKLPRWMAFALIAAGFVSFPCMIVGAKFSIAFLSWLGVSVFLVAALAPSADRWAKATSASDYPEAVQ